MMVSRICVLSLFLSMAFSAASEVGRGRLVHFHLYSPDANRVAVAGTFNGWDQFMTPMEDPDRDGVWTASYRIPDGRHEYKFVINGSDWIPDPLREVSSGADGNSFLLVGPHTYSNAMSMTAISAPTQRDNDTVRILVRYRSPVAERVSLVHSHRPPAGAVTASMLALQDSGVSAIEMVQSDSLIWTAAFDKPAGSTRYISFIVRRAGSWYRDGNGPRNGFYDVPFSCSTVIRIADLVAYQRFAFPAPAADSVSVAGTFNAWDTTTLHLRKGRDGVWAGDLPLRSGRHAYKYFVNGRDWYADPAGEPDPLGFGNTKLTPRVADPMAFRFLNQDDIVARDSVVLIVPFTIRYFAPGASDVTMVWGINDWQLPDSGFPLPDSTQSFNRSSVATPLLQAEGEEWVVSMSLPVGTRMNFLMRVHDGARTSWDRGPGGRGFDEIVTEPRELSLIGMAPTSQGSNPSDMIMGSLAAIFGLVALIGFLLAGRRPAHE